VIEAAASGVPVVASGSRTGGGVVVPGETGVLVDDFRVETLADAVEELLRNTERRRALGRAARAHAETNLDPARKARRIESIYRRNRAGARAHPDPLRAPWAAAGRCAVVARAADLATRPALRAARLLPGGPAAELFCRGGRDGPQV
jgi:hypothetical protein